MSNWKDDHADDKAESGLTWDEYHDRRFVHVDELDDMADSITTLSEHVEACRNEYRDMKRELHELKVLFNRKDD